MTINVLDDGCRVPVAAQNAVAASIGEAGERQVLQLVARGHTYREIGDELTISPKTAENHVRNILGKLHLSRRADLVRYALRHGLDRNHPRATPFHPLVS